MTNRFKLIFSVHPWLPQTLPFSHYKNTMAMRNVRSGALSNYCITSALLWDDTTYIGDTDNDDCQQQK